VIVGFPGETDEEAEATVGLIREVGFLGVFGFKYSQRPYTPALKLADDVSEAEKGRRLARVFEASEALLAAHLPTLVGSGQRVLIEGKSKTGEGMVTGRTRRNEIVHLRGAGELDLVGRQLDVVVTRANKHSVEAELAEGERARIEALGRRAPRAPGVGERATGTPRRSLPMAPRREQAAQARPAGGPGDTAVEG
jgi:tRNA-2-methylthio-N6-dimethylallyladenosine synthase